MRDRLNADTITGAAIVLVALVAGFEAFSFDTSFPTDPLGPKVFPLVSVALLLLGGGWVAMRPRAARREPVPGAVWAAAASFVVYALALDPIGFLLATVLEFVALSVLFGGRPAKAAAAGTLFSLALYVLFVNGLGLVLPIGSLFIIGG